MNLLLQLSTFRGFNILILLIWSVYFYLDLENGVKHLFLISVSFNWFIINLSVNFF